MEPQNTNGSQQGFGHRPTGSFAPSGPSVPRQPMQFSARRPGRRPAGHSVDPPVQSVAQPIQVRVTPAQPTPPPQPSFRPLAAPQQPAAPLKDFSSPRPAIQITKQLDGFSVPVQRSVPQVAPTPIAPESVQQWSAPQAAQPQQAEPASPQKLAQQFTQAQKTEPVSRVSKLAMVGMSAFGVVGSMLVLFGGSVYMHQKSVATIHLASKSVAIVNPQLAGRDLQTSCYGVSMPLVYKIYNATGCSVQLMPSNKEKMSPISINAGPLVSSVPFAKADAYLLEAISQKNPQNTVTDITRDTITIDGVKALKMTYSLNNGPKQVVVYVTNLPARFDQSGLTIASFGVNGYYNSIENQDAFDSVVSSIQWVR